MAMRNISPKSQQRTRVFETYRGRGHRNNNLWLVYSVKTRRDWILNSDRKLIHWIRYLETDPRVTSFELITDDTSAAHEADCDDHYADVWLTNGSRERHQVTASRPGRQLVLDLPSATQDGGVYKNFSEDELAPHAFIATRWLKAIAYAAAIREQEHAHVRTALAVTFHSRGQGTLRDVLADVEGFDPSVVMGMLVRAAILGIVELDLFDRPLCMHTSWRVRAKSHHVDA
jgi:hypothetical protein